MHLITGTHTRYAGGSAPPRHRVFARFRATLRTHAGEDAPAALLGGASPAPRGLRAFLGVMSDARDRRDALRATWFPDTAALQQCVAALGQHHTSFQSRWPEGRYCLLGSPGSWTPVCCSTAQQRCIWSCISYHFCWLAGAAVFGSIMTLDTQAVQR